MTLRADQRAATERRIVAAVADLITHEHPATITVPDVARRAGLGVATVYRYFPNKEALLDAAVPVGNERTWQALADRPSAFADAAAIVRQSFAELADHLDLARNQLLSPTGRAMRKRRARRKRALLARAASDAGLPDDEATQRLLVLIELLVSAPVLIELLDQHGHDPETAAAHVGWAVEALIAATADHSHERGDNA